MNPCADAAYETVEVGFYVFPDCERTFGRRVRAAGGRLGKERAAAGPQRAYAAVPASCPELIDEIHRAAEAHWRGSTSFIVRDVRGVPAAEQVLPGRGRVYQACEMAPDETASRFVARRFREALEAVDWNALGLLDAAGRERRDDLAAEIRRAAAEAALAVLRDRGVPVTAEAVMLAEMRADGLGASLARLELPNTRREGGEIRAAVRGEFVRLYGGDAAERCAAEADGGPSPGPR